MALNSSVRLPVVAAIATLAVILAGSANASAQNAGGVSPVPVIAKLPNSIVAQFKANPEGLLAAYPAGGLGLSSRARSLALTDPSLVPILINAAKAGNEAQQAAIGAGMAEAARILAVVDPQLAQEIQQAIAQSGSESLIAAFAAASNATQTASTSHHVSTNASAAVIAGGAGAAGSTGGSSVGPSGSSGSNAGSNSGAAWLGASNAPGSPGAGGGLTSSTGQSTSPSKSSL